MVAGYTLIQAKACPESPNAEKGELPFQAILPSMLHNS